MLFQTPTTIPSELRDFPEWHRGRERYAVWVLRCDKNKAVEQKFKAARAHLEGYLLASYPRQPHITLFVCGFLGEKQRYNDDFTEAQVDAQILALRTADLQAFDIEIGGLNSFASAPFLEVYDPVGGISRLRAVLSRGGNEFRTAPYEPHLTVGLYQGIFPSQAVSARMAAFSNEPVRLKVAVITLATYQAKVFAGELSYRYSFSLQSQ